MSFTGCMELPAKGNVLALPQSEHLWPEEQKFLGMSGNNFKVPSFFFFLWPHLWHMEVPRLGVTSELQPLAWPQPQQHWI